MYMSYQRNKIENENFELKNYIFKNDIRILKNTQNLVNKLSNVKIIYITP